MNKVFLGVFLISLYLMPSHCRAEDKVLWPPEDMQNLPADYLDRLHNALKIQSERFSEQNKNKNPVLMVRIGIAALALGQNTDELKTYFEDDEFGWKPSEKWGFSLFSASYLRLYALYNDRTGMMKGRLSPKAQDNLEKSFWACAKEYSKLAEAKLDVWESDGSENHHITSRVSDFLVAQFLKDNP